MLSIACFCTKLESICHDFIHTALNYAHIKFYLAILTSKCNPSLCFVRSLLFEFNGGKKCQRWQSPSWLPLTCSWNHWPFFHIQVNMHYSTTHYKLDTCMHARLLKFVFVNRLSRKVAAQVVIHISSIAKTLASDQICTAAYALIACNSEPRSKKSDGKQ